jgi:hypothetical protein
VIIATPAAAQVARPSGAGLRPPERRRGGVPVRRNPEERQLRWQATYVTQRKPSFNARYSGPNSLSPNADSSFSFTTTAMFGTRVWEGGELYINPEIAAGQPLLAYGFAASPTANWPGRPDPIPSSTLPGRSSARPGVSAATGRSSEFDQNQLGGGVDERRLVPTAGIFPLIEVFDDNAYSHDPRTQFLNWSASSPTARSTSRPMPVAIHAVSRSSGSTRAWAVRARVASRCRCSPTGSILTPALGKSYGDQLELEHEYHLAERPGRCGCCSGATVQSWAPSTRRGWPGYGRRSGPGMWRRSDAIRRSTAGHQHRSTAAGPRWGGAFLRVGSSSDDRRETDPYTEIGGSVSAGVLLAGAQWDRPRDALAHRLRAQHAVR